MTYEYLCAKCGRTFEVEQRITDPPLVYCVFATPGSPVLGRAAPAGPGELFSEVGGAWCGGPVKRLVASPAFMLKGKGWAKDGYR